MEYSPDENNKITLASEFNIYNPRLPMKMDFPGPQFCSDNGDVLLIIGSIPEEIIKPRHQNLIDPPALPFHSLLFCISLRSEDC